MNATVIDLTTTHPLVNDERETYEIDWKTTLLVCREANQTLVVTSTGQLLRVKMRLKSLLTAFADRYPLTSDAGWFASRCLYQEHHQTVSRMTRSFINLELAMVAYAGGTSPQAGYYMQHHLVEAIVRSHGLELVFAGGIRVLTTAIPQTQNRLAMEAEEIAHDQRMVLGHIHQDQQWDLASQRVAEQMAINYFKYAFEHHYRIRERKLLDSPKYVEWL